MDLNVNKWWQRQVQYRNFANIALFINGKHRKFAYCSSTEINRITYMTQANTSEGLLMLVQKAFKSRTFRWTVRNEIIWIPHKPVVQVVTVVVLPGSILGVRFGGSWSPEAWLSSLCRSRSSSKFYTHYTSSTPTPNSFHY
jgi:hypothetical protein